MSSVRLISSGHLDTKPYWDTLSPTPLKFLCSFLSYHRVRGRLHARLTARHVSPRVLTCLSLHVLAPDVSTAERCRISTNALLCCRLRCQAGNRPGCSTHAMVGQRFGGSNFEGRRNTELGPLLGSSPRCGVHWWSGSLLCARHRRPTVPRTSTLAIAETSEQGRDSIARSRYARTYR
ncbi:hypothetical protein GY45DRAFT_688710 [Cubamyces sp. BRFM 1775]|nr:hypothetical protein GY45DRAFT_688710 [Cubamyces sp. BRFM 1775]